MRRLPYRVFLPVFSIANAIVWFFIFYGLGRFLYARVAGTDDLRPPAAVSLLCWGLLLPTVLAVQGAIVNLRAQFLAGRFLPPPPRDGSGERPRNPWVVAGVTAAAFWVIALPVFNGVLPALLSDDLGVPTAALLMAAVGGLIVLSLSGYVSHRELRSYLAGLESVPAARASATTYAVAYIGVPWAVINFVINALLAWVTYRQSTLHAAATVSIAELRIDLVVMSFLISVFMALSAFPEAETDFRLGWIRMPPTMPPMPRLWTRYAYALSVALAMYLIVTGMVRAFGVLHVSLVATVVIKGFSAALIAGSASSMCAQWALGRCAQRRDAAVLVKVTEPAPAL